MGRLGLKPENLHLEILKMSVKFSVNDTSATTQAYFLIRGMGYNELTRQIRKSEATVLSALESILKINGYGWTSPCMKTY
jgi:hypothetical protein